MSYKSGKMARKSNLKTVLIYNNHQFLSVLYFLALPNYEESRHTQRGNINEEELHAFGVNEFAPLYPVYNIPSPTPVLSANNRNAGFVNQSFVK